LPTVRGRADGFRRPGSPDRPDPTRPAQSRIDPGQPRGATRRV